MTKAAEFLLSYAKPETVRERLISLIDASCCAMANFFVVMVFLAFWRLVFTKLYNLADKQAWRVPATQIGAEFKKEENDKSKLGNRNIC